LPQRGIFRPGQRLAEVDQSKTPGAEKFAHLSEEKTIRSDVEIVGLHDEQANLTQGPGGALENGNFEAMSAKLEEIGPGQALLWPPAHQSWSPGFG
jgi:hypothetical protein